ncbi:hypothetical protein AB6A40_008826 [Gnathostoma spinigerum]|uniref:DNA-directed RNA polymerase III subunit n=1 Tax=Gnathostoma spinigerum TaxID=75299 RepID=A0ABD6EZK2_9BILA
MSKGGRVPSSGSGVRAVANALGIARHEMNAFTKIITEAPQLYPAVTKTILPLSNSDELQYMAELRQEVLNRFRESAFYLEQPEVIGDIRRYTDKYRSIEKEKFEPDWSRLPSELYWRPSKQPKETAKKRKRTYADGNANVEEKLAELEKKENKGVTENEDHEDEEEEEDSEREERNENDDQEPLSDDDYLEEDNDYIHNYFDNGEDYGDAGSDDNLDNDNTF